ncbi:uncharacterized protein [Notamacropus eugenii]|uniref:uncharacterized protein isoform X4 n=1 Tax=Notamacropus eugenii TaxID=9315 RepID=UPI003B67B143
MEGSSPQGDPMTQNVLKKSHKNSWRASWGRHEINLLLEAIFKTGKAHQIISGTSQRKNKLWREITETLAESQVGYTAEQCRTKWKHLKTQFRFEQTRYLTTGVHSDPLPHFYEKMSTLWKMAARCSPKAGPSKRSKQPTRAKRTLELQKQNKKEEIPAPHSGKHPDDPDPDKSEVLPGTQSQPPQAGTSSGEHQSKDSAISHATKGVDGCAVNQTALEIQTLEEVEKPRARQPGKETAFTLHLVLSSSIPPSVIVAQPQGGFPLTAACYETHHQSCSLPLALQMLWLAQLLLTRSIKTGFGHDVKHVTTR